MHQTFLTRLSSILRWKIPLKYWTMRELSNKNGFRIQSYVSRLGFVYNSEIQDINWLFIQYMIMIYMFWKNQIVCPNQTISKSCVCTAGGARGPCSESQTTWTDTLLIWYKGFISMFQQTREINLLFGHFKILVWSNSLIQARDYWNIEHLNARNGASFENLIWIYQTL